MLHHKRRSFRQAAALLLTAVMPVALLAGCGNKDGDYPGSSKGDVIATYKDGGKVTEKEFAKYTAFQMFVNPDKAMYMSIDQLKENFVKQYVVSKVFAPQISDENKKKVDESADDFKAQLKDELKGDNADQLKSYMDEQDLSIDEAYKFFKHEYAFQLYYQAKLDELKPSVTEDEIKKAYDADPSAFNIVTLRHILVQTVDQSTGASTRTDEEALKRAQEVKAKLDAGGDWAALAKEYSDDPGSKDNGGLYEDKASSGYVAEFAEAANTQEIGKIGDPVQTQYGYHVIKVEKRTTTAYDKLTDANKDTLKSDVAAKKVSDFLTAEQDKLDIKVTLPAPASPSASPSASGSPGASGTPSASPSASPGASESPAASPSASPSASAK